MRPMPLTLIGFFILLCIIISTRYYSSKEISRETALAHHRRVFHVEQKTSLDGMITFSPFTSTTSLSKSIWKMNHNRTLRAVIVIDEVRKLLVLVVEDAHTHRRYSLIGMFQVTQFEKIPWPAPATVAFIARQDDGFYYHYTVDVDSLASSYIFASEQQSTSSPDILDETLLD